MLKRAFPCVFLHVVNLSVWLARSNLAVG